MDESVPDSAEESNNEAAVPESGLSELGDNCSASCSQGGEVAGTSAAASRSHRWGSRRTTASIQSMAPATKETWLLSLNVDELRVNVGAKLNFPRRRHAVFRVPPHIRKLRPQCYDVDILPLGLYNRDFVTETPIDQLKLRVLSVFLEHLKIDQQAWNTFCREVARPPPTGLVPYLEDFYNDDVGLSFMTTELVQSALIIDAFFVVAYLMWLAEGSAWWFSYPPLLLQRTMLILSSASFQAIEPAVARDIFWQCENQIPLFLVENVWNRVASPVGDFNPMLRYIRKMVLVGSGLPFKDAGNEEVRLESCAHLLQCLHRAVCPDGTRPLLVHEEESFKSIWRCKLKLPVMQRLLRFATQISSTVSRRFQTPSSVLTEDRLTRNYAIPSASELHKSGIRFKGIETDVRDVRFHKASHLTATLYLPKIRRIEDSSQAILLNMCIYESMKAPLTSGGLIPYVCLMDELINAEEDVRLLMQGNEPVIAGNLMGDNMIVVNLFTNTLQNFCTPRPDRHERVRAEILRWYSKRWRRQLIRFLDRFVTAPWLVVSLIAATILVIFTVLQIIYTILGFYNHF